MGFKYWPFCAHSKAHGSAEHCRCFMSKADSFGVKNALQKHPIIEKVGTCYIPFKE